MVKHVDQAPFVPTLLGSVLVLATAALAACSSDDGDGGSALPPPFPQPGSGGSGAATAGPGGAGASGLSPTGGGDITQNPDLGNPGTGGVPGSGGTGSAAPGSGGSDMGNAGTGGAAPGAGGTGAVVDVPPGDGSCPPGALFCEDFESFAAGPIPATAPFTPTIGGGATIDIDGTTAIGTRALHINAPGNSFGYIRVNDFSPPGNDFFGRVRIRVDEFPTSPDYAHWVIVEATGQGGGLVRPVGGQYIPGQGQTSLWGVGNDQGTSGDWTSWQPSAPAVSSTWICYEWQMRTANANIDVWLDEVPQPALSVSAEQRRDYNGARFQFPTFSTIWFGWWLFQANNGTREVWLDDIALAQTRIGCGGG